MQTLSCSMWDLVPWPGIEPGPPALGMWSLNHWITSTFPALQSLELPASTITWTNSLKWISIHMYKYIWLCACVLYVYIYANSFPGGRVVKNLPTQGTQETWVWSLVREVPLEKEKATHSSILAWKIPWTEEPGSLQPMGLQRVRHDWAHRHMHTQTL